MDIKICYQGIPGSNSEQALAYYFNNTPHTSISKPDFRSVFKDINDGISDYGVIPIENTLGGSVLENYDLLDTYNVKITDEIRLNICHCLCCKNSDTIDTITKVISHPQALQQCKTNISRLSLTTMPYNNTATSAEYVSNSEGADACISSYKAAKLYGLKILNNNFADQPEKNITRFIIIAKSNTDKPNKCNFTDKPRTYKTSIIIALKDGIGALSNILDVFMNW